MQDRVKAALHPNSFLYNSLARIYRSVSLLGAAVEPDFA
jgi:hypothetical protein